MSEFPQGTPGEPTIPQQPVPETAPSNRRPTGLTVLAILNFIFGGMGIIALFVLVVAQSFLQDITEGKVLIWANYLMLFMRLVAIILVISSAIGYLGPKWFLGWVLGNAYACVAILNTILYAVLLDETNITSLFWLAYPITTLFLLNFVFRKDFKLGTNRAPGAAPQIIVLAAVVLLAVGGISAVVLRGGAREISDVEIRIDKGLLEDTSGEPAADVYASNIAFPKVTVTRAGINKLRLDWIVRNDGDKTVKYLKVRIVLLDEDGVQVAGDTDLFAHDLPFGENNTAIPPRSSKRAGGEIENPRHWKKGKVVVTILELQVE